MKEVLTTTQIALRDMVRAFDERLNREFRLISDTMDNIDTYVKMGFTDYADQKKEAIFDDIEILKAEISVMMDSIDMLTVIDDIWEDAIEFEYQLLNVLSYVEEVPNNLLVRNHIFVCNGRRYEG